ncbi:hypothetical protein PHET_08996 [Paragonimus heterotremus]|uniref:Uncharacterized protein n=1 Tax=Paragonimus heterotremus TaxID=100268 RepID=A0A8J4SLH8_9TREM|nr:hypothetical protein PHET_08996 [Paragonimus heterotremus]
MSSLDGNIEGVYPWINMNVMTSRTPNPRSATSESRHALDRTVDTLDSGRGSTVITFEPRTSDTFGVKNSTET